MGGLGSLRDLRQSRSPTVRLSQVPPHTLVSHIWYASRQDDALRFEQ